MAEMRSNVVELASETSNCGTPEFPAIGEYMAGSMRLRLVV